MRQVPQYTIVGNGRVAYHVVYYFRHLNIPYYQWARATDSRNKLDDYLSQSTHVLMLIDDAAIDPFIEQYGLKEQNYLQLIHFSGSLTSKWAWAAHPLYSFRALSAYPVEDYQQIPFVIAQEAPEFSTLLPGLSHHPHYRISSEERAYYHALCVLANNFSTLLWNKFFNNMEKKFAVPASALQPFLRCTFENIAQDRNAALTGPLQRKDKDTLRCDLEALEGDPFHPIFKSFLCAFS